MQPIRKAAAFHGAAGKFINDDNLASLQHVMRVTGKKPVRTKRLINVMQQPNIFNVIKRCIANGPTLAKQGFGMFNANFTKRNTIALFIKVKIFIDQ